MKLRIRGNSLRFRLTRGEIARLLDGESILEEVCFSNSKHDLLRYSVVPSERPGDLAARFEKGEICLEIPMSRIHPWATSEQVGIESTQPAGDGKGLRILVEKDFQCLQPRSDEDESDNFPNPEQSPTSTLASGKVS